ncbi:MAG TPA: YhcH/YjgK/YiaL family protein [Bacteroidales bacterium]|nr:YhcH/YjgK/YiaL family protein [Bacteroidales bacterium]
MEKIIVKIMVLASFLSFFGCNSSTDPATWSSKKIDKWFKKAEWLNGWTVSPDASINKKEFAVSYFRNKERWDKALLFLKESELSKLELLRYDIDGDNLFATVSEYLTKNEEDAKFEAHQKYIDIQYVISGAEQIGIAPMSQKNEVLEPYDAEKDIEFFTVIQGANVEATPKKFFIFFPTDAHRPGLKDGDNTKVRKIVVKVKVE